MSNPIFQKTVSTKSVRVGERTLQNHNKLLWSVEGANGVKTGYTKAAGRILVSGACRENRQLIVVTIDAPDDWNDHKTLLEQGFSGYSLRKILTKGQCVGALTVAGGQAGSVELLCAEDFSYSLAEGEAVEIQLPGNAFIYAPVAEDQSAGYAHILVDGKPVAKVALVYGSTVERQPDEKKTLWQRLFGD